MKKTLIATGFAWALIMAGCVNTAENGAPTNRLVDTTSVRSLPKMDVTADTTAPVPEVQGSPADSAAGAHDLNSHEDH